MTTPQNAHYLESRVLTAPPQRLQLMLIEGAIRFGREALAAMDNGDTIAAATPLMRMFDIMAELLAGAREKKTSLNEQIAAFYTYLFRLVAEAKVNENAEKLGEALELLEFERQTWQLVCDKIGNSADPSNAAPQAAAPIATKPRPAIAPLLGGGSTATSLGISLEA
jgi:flagellar secretion chaperone FliS